MAARGVIIIIIAKESRGEGRVDRSVEGQRGGEEKKKKSTRRISGCREAETAAGLWKMVNRLNSSAQPSRRNYLISSIISARVHFSCHYRDAVSIYDLGSLERGACTRARDRPLLWSRQPGGQRKPFEKWFSFRLSPQASSLPLLSEHARHAAFHLFNSPNSINSEIRIERFNDLSRHIDIFTNILNNIFRKWYKFLKEKKSYTEEEWISNNNHCRKGIERQIRPNSKVSRN